MCNDRPWNIDNLSLDAASLYIEVKIKGKCTFVNHEVVFLVQM